MPDCLRNGLRRYGRIARLGRNRSHGDIRHLQRTLRDPMQLLRVAGQQAKMHTPVRKFSRGGRAGCAAGTGYECNFFVEFQFRNSSPMPASGDHAVRPADRRPDIVSGVPIYSKIY
jgi:hypothetical protein